MENLADNCHEFFRKINNTARLLNLNYTLGPDYNDQSNICTLYININKLVLDCLYIRKTANESQNTLTKL